jgi:cytochrome c
MMGMQSHQVKGREGHPLGGCIWAFAMLLILLLAGCSRLPGSEPTQEVPGGDPDRGQVLIQEYGCESCHTIPGVRNANATVGPPLDNWANRHYIAGLLPNTPENLVTWIRFPQEVSPGNAMPDMGVDERDALDIAAFLYTLRR